MQHALFFKHGTTHAYRFYECRCEACRRAVLDVNMRWRARAKAEQRPAYLAQLEKQRQRYYNYPKSSCEDCGAPIPTNGKKVHQRCKPCASHVVGISQRAQGPRSQAVLEVLKDGPLHRKEISKRSNTELKNLSVVLTRLVRWNLIKRIDVGVYQLSDAP